MPEYVELLSSYLVVKHWLDDMQKLSGKYPIWRTLHVDTTIPEDDRKFAVPDVRAKDSFQIPLEAPAALALKVEPSFKLRRGKSNNQTLIYPPVPTLRASRPRLLDVQFHPRNMILHFMIELPSPQEFWMRVQMLTHMLRSKLALGLGFTVRMPEDGFQATRYVLAFQSLDLLFSVTYRSTRDGLGILPYNIYSDFEKELKRVAQWATKRRGRRRLDRYSSANLAMKVIRAANTIFPGVGVYTVSELFYMAGLAPDLTEGEVFDNPSRFARLMEAYYSYAAEAHMNIWKYIRPYLGGGYSLAIKNEHRSRYARRLHVYAKSRTCMPVRLRDQYIELNDLIASTDHLNRRRYTGYFDPFEPTYLRLGLSKPHNLGALIFSKGVWEQMGGKVWLDSDNALWAYFKSHLPVRVRPKSPSGELLPHNLLLDVTFAPRTTYLHANMVSDSKVVAEHYAISGAYLNGGVFIDSLAELVSAWRNTCVYVGGKKDVWSVVRIDSCLTFHERTPLAKRTYFRRIPESAKKVKTFDYIVNYTNQYAVGPLDFDGIGYIYHRKRLICRTDPLVPRYIAMRHAVHLREDPEKRKAAQKSLNLKEQQEHKGNSITSKVPKKKRKVSTNHVTASTSAQAVDRPAKRRRVCTDMKIAAAGIEVRERPRRLRSGAA
ncbi:hypothetical protein EYR40_008254 [Pleurotus pulmonarius]|nr:hypothetical protein EYR36_009076 [Pleurotus pulmonarius]KAF4597787.1 hypothetical protein EYR40_008254 [Pleurotus pulmonarius]